jgi:aspartate 1-decarboxylase
VGFRFAGALALPIIWGAGAPRGSGAISLNGAAARKAHVGDPLIICTYGLIDEKELHHHQPKIVLVGETNQIKSIKKVV